jgi:hypothetical protein
MNLEHVRPHRQGAAGILQAVLFSGWSAGKMPAALCGSWRVFHFCEDFATTESATRNLQPPTSNFQLPTSNLQLPTSNLCRGVLPGNGSWTQSDIEMTSRLNKRGCSVRFGASSGTPLAQSETIEPGNGSPNGLSVRARGTRKQPGWAH